MLKQQLEPFMRQTKWMSLILAGPQVPKCGLDGLSGADNSSANAPKPVISRQIPLIMHSAHDPE